MTLQEFIEENNMNYKNMAFCYEYYTRDTFYSFAHIESCKRKKFITPTKKFYIKDNKCHIICNLGKKIISFENFINREYPKDIDIVLDIENEEIELDTTGYSNKDEDLWNYELDF